MARAGPAAAAKVEPTPKVSLAVASDQSCLFCGEFSRESTTQRDPPGWKRLVGGGASSGCQTVNQLELRRESVRSDSIRWAPKI